MDAIQIPAGDSAKPRRWKWLRIGWSALSLIVCVLLILLWVRSYSWWDFLRFDAVDTRIKVESVEGSIKMSMAIARLLPEGFWQPADSRLDMDHAPAMEMSFGVEPGFYVVQFFDGAYQIHFPHWFAVLLFATVAAASWLPYHRLRRFSLKTIFLIIAILSCLLGLLVWLVRG